MTSDREEQAKQQFQEAYEAQISGDLDRAVTLYQKSLELYPTAEAQISGDLDRAVTLYQKSLELYPTAEAHTFLGWTYHFQGKIEEAIAECKRAIAVDPDFGNPYNDIGAYLIDLKRLDEAIPWLEQAMKAKRYEPRHFPYYNLGRVYLFKGHLNRARELFQKALEIEPRYLTARQAIDKLRHMVN